MNRESPSEPDNVSERFHQSLRAALLAGAKLDLGEVAATDASGDPGAISGNATLAKIDRLESLLDSNNDSTDENASPGLPATYFDAYRLYARTGRMDLALDSLAIRRTVDEDLSRTLRPVWFYLALLLLIATGGMAIFSEFSAPQIAAIRADLELTPTASVTDTWWAGQIPRVLLFVLPLLACLMCLLAMSTRASSWVADAIGGGGYRDDRFKAMQTRVQSAIAPSQTEGGSEGRQARLSFLAEHRTILANNRLMRLRSSLPTLLVVLIGGGGVLLYCLVLFAPLIVIIHDMANVAADQGVWP